MSSIYFKRWTRMHFFPALKHFHKLNVIGRDFDIFKPIIETNQFEQGLVKWAGPKWKGKTPSLDKKLLDRLFSKYPDLKYEKLQLDSKLDAEKENMFSYAYQFIRKQRILMSKGISESKAFEIVQQEYQSKMTRKLDQTLLARGLAIGNRARSLMTTYQQQMEYESRLKALRTQREVAKYQQRIDAIKEKVQKIQNPTEEEYKRVLYTIPPNKMTETIEDLLGLQIPKEEEPTIRMTYISAFAERVNNMFHTYYTRASSKDRLGGLTDEEIKSQILSSPTKIRKQLQQLLKIVKKYNVVLGENGELDLSEVSNPKVKEMLQNNASVKVALMLQDLQYEQPHRIQLRRELRERKQILESKDDKLTEQERETILKNKKLVYKEIQPFDLQEGFRTYKAFETYEQRLLRIQIKWLQSKIAQLYNDSSETHSESLSESTDKLKSLVDRFRRLKFRVDQKIKYLANQDIEEVFEEHKLLEGGLDVGKNVEYETLFHYLKIRQEERRMTPADAVNDDKIHQMISNRQIHEDPKPEGWKKIHEKNN